MRSKPKPKPKPSPAARAVQAHRRRLRQRGLVRVELRARPADRALLRNIAARLADDPKEAQRLRTMLAPVSPPPTAASGLAIYEAFRNSPLVGADLDLTRDHTPGGRPFAW